MRISDWSSVVCSSDLHAARKFQRAPPLVFGLGVMTCTPGLMRSFQSLMCLGLPLLTRNTMVDVYGALLCGRRLCQFSGSALALSAMASLSSSSACGSYKRRVGYEFVIKWCYRGSTDILKQNLV